MKPGLTDIAPDAAGALIQQHVTTERGRSAILGVGWSALNTGSAMLISVLVFVVTSRILGPEEFGIVALGFSIVTIVGCATPGGFGEAIVQRKAISRAHLDTVFWICLGSGVILYLPLLFFAGTVAELSGEPMLALLLPFFGVKLILDLMAVVPQALVVRAMQFKYIAARTAIGNSIGGIVCVAMALNGYGLWALAAAPMATSIVSLVILMKAARWRPGPHLDIGALRQMLRFGLYASGTNTLHHLNLDRLILGLIAGPSVLGLYFLGKRLFDILSGVTVGMIASVTTVFFASTQEDGSEAQIKAFRNAMRATTLLTFPVFGGLYVIADGAVPLILGDHWLPALPAVKAFAFFGLFAGVLAASTSLATGLGRADLAFGVDLLRNLLSAGAILWALDDGFEAVMAALVVVHAVMLPSGFLITRKLIKISAREYLTAPIQPLLTTLTMAGFLMLLPMALPGVQPVPMLALKFVLAAAVYVALSLSFSKEQIVELRRVFAERGAS
mgnify:CR=1 FL=1